MDGLPGDPGILQEMPQVERYQEIHTFEGTGARHQCYVESRLCDNYGSNGYIIYSEPAFTAQLEAPCPIHPP